MDMKWIEITSDVYFGLYNRYYANLSVFGVCTHKQNDSRFASQILTEWGFAEDEEPLIKCVRKPESQVTVERTEKWPSKYFLRILAETK